MDTSYENQLSRLKKIVPNLASPSLVELCHAWIERFTTCTPEEEMHRPPLVNLFVEQLSRDRKLGKIFLGTNIKLRFRDILFDYRHEFENKKSINRCDLALGECKQTVLPKSDFQACNKCADQSEAKYSMLLGKVSKFLRNFENRLSLISKCEDPLEQMGKLKLEDFDDTCPCALGPELRPTIDRIQRHWTDVYTTIQASKSRKSRSTKCGSSQARSTSTESESGTIDTISSISLSKSVETPPDSHSVSSEAECKSMTKYKHFALKCARRMEKMQLEIATLKRANQIRDSTESIRYAALKSDLIERAGAKQQAEMCAMIDQLDERYREVITKTMALSFAGTTEEKLMA